VIDCGAHLVEYRALLVDCRALLIGPRARLAEYRAYGRVLLIGYSDLFDRV